MLNKEENSPGYLCGRLFAVYEYAQERSVKDEGGKSTLRDRFFSSAMTRPQTTFIELVKLSNYYFTKLSDKTTLVMKLRKTENEIMSKMESQGFPTTLGNDEQGQFIIGYYHQRGAFEYKPQDANEEVVKTNNEEKTNA